MPDPRAGIRVLFLFYGRICLGIGVFLLAVLGLLWLANLLIDWKHPIDDPTDWFTFAGGLIVVLVTMGPYVFTVGRLGQVQRIRPTIINRQFGAPSQQRQRIYAIILGVIALIFVVALVIAQSFIIWLTCGSLFVFMSLLLFYIGWRIGRFEKKGRMTIQAQSYNWYFDKVNFVGVIRP